MKIIKLPFKVKRPILACGADIKGAFALAKGNTAYLADGFGDLSDPDNLEAYEASIFAGEKRLGIKPEVIACDLHPGYFSSRFAEGHASRLSIRPPCGIQHHEAHVASAIVEHSIKTDVIGAAFDGTGYGSDGRIWGGEFFTGNLRSFRRAARFEYIPMPGGDAAISQPWRMAVSYLYRAFGASFPKLNIAVVKALQPARLRVIRKMIDGGINSPFTSSAGRLFDGVASLVLSRAVARTEAELPIELERIASRDCNDRYEVDIAPEDGVLVIGISGLIRGVVGDLRTKIDKGVISAKFHNTIAEAVAAAALRLRKASSASRKVILSGGVFQNRYLAKRTALILDKNGFEVFINSGISVNDNGIPAGQLAIANARGSCV